MPAAEFEKLRAIVFARASVREDLRKIDDKADFALALVELATKNGIAITAGDVEAALTDGRRAWIERWI